MKKFFLIAAMAAATIFAASCAKVETGSIVLQGSIEGDPGQVIIVSYLPGQDIEYHYPEVNDGKFEFTLDGVEGFADLIVSVGGVEHGARINALDTLRMGFVVKEIEKDVEVSYDGANEKESRIWTDFYETYMHWSTYNLPPSDPGMTIDECLALLDENDAKFRNGHKADMDRYYTHRADLSYALLKAILLDQKAEIEGTDSFDLPEYKELLEAVDPNDPEQVTFPLVYRWAYFHMREFGDEPVSGAVGFLKNYGKDITNPTVRTMLAKNLASNCMSDIDINNPGQYETLFNALDNFDPEHPELVEACRIRIEAAVNSRPGKPVPDTVMETLDGRQVRLSSLFGKILYIDVWATWCGPCVRETPYFKALAEKFKNDDRIRFISLSVDEDKEQWTEFIKEEKPFWPQYILGGSQYFCEKVGINTIPRFLLIGADGCFIDGNCARPSDDGIVDILMKAIEGR